MELSFSCGELGETEETGETGEMGEHVIASYNVHHVVLES